MEEERLKLLDLFDFFWFHHNVLHHSPSPAIPLPASDSDLTGAETSSTGETQLLPSHKPEHRRSLSDELPFTSSSDSVLLAHPPPKLQTIFSGKATSEGEVANQGIASQDRDRTEKVEARGEEISRGHGDRRRKRRERRTRGMSQDSKSKSLSELEFEELKGFMDLGFTFSEAESDQRLLSIVPGLQRRGRRRASSEEGVSEEAEEGEGRVDEVSTISRPYLSEAWSVANHRIHAHDHLLRNWRVPAAGEGVDMKDHLRSWAHTVASAVR